LATVVEAHRTGDEEELSDPNRAVEKGLTRPRAFQHPGIIPQDSPENPEAAPGGLNARIDDAAYTRDIISHARLGEGDE
jgi:hypothetical protein